ncbi:hypothetical protein [Phormidesmis sp. 146-33]
MLVQNGAETLNVLGTLLIVMAVFEALLTFWKEELVGVFVL